MNKPSHSACTVDALNVFKSLKGISISNDDIVALLGRFAEKEDEGVQRPFHWHFFNNGNRIENSIFPGERTSEKRFEKLIKLLEKSLEKYNRHSKRGDAKDILEYSARLIHHIHDMGTPSHVVPVYHDPFLKDAYETFCESLSSVQSTSLVETLSSPASKVASIELTREEFAAYKKQIMEAPTGDNPHCFCALYTLSAHWTLKHLRDSVFTLKENGQKTVKTWTAFWEENAVNQSSSHQGFGNFGPLGNNFGKPTFTSGGIQWQVDNSQYLLLVRDLYKRMVLGTLFVLDYINEKSSVLSEQREVVVNGVGD